MSNEEIKKEALKIAYLEILTIEFLENEEKQIFLNSDIIKFLLENNFSKNDLLEYIYILINTLTYNDNGFKISSVVDGFSFWHEDIKDNKKSMFIDYIKSEV